MIDVVLADDHPVVRAGLRAVLESQPDLRGGRPRPAGRGPRRWRSTGGTGADVVLMDLRLPDDGRGAGDAPDHRRCPAARVLVLTTYDTDADILAAVEAGRHRLPAQGRPAGGAGRAVRAAAAGGRPRSAPAVQRRLMGGCAPPGRR